MMKQSNLDYSNTIIYKICCKDLNITDVYIGHTTNFQKRLLQHKTVCNKILKNDLKVYKFIREHGGWDNWDMVEFARYNCKDLDEARLKEHEHFISTNSTLNTNFPISLGTETNIFVCKKCTYTTSRKSSYEKHIMTQKHKMKKNESLNENIKNYICKCQKKINSRTSLWRHRKVCCAVNTQYSAAEEEEEENNTITSDSMSPDLILNIIQQNQEFKDLLLEQNKIIIEMSKKIR